MKKKQEGEEPVIRYTIKMDIEVSRRKKINCIVNHKKEVVRWCDTITECLEWLRDMGEDTFIASTTAINYVVSFIKTNSSGGNTNG